MLKERLSKLDDVQLGLLLRALEEGLSQWVRVEERYYVGVNVTNNTELLVQESKGDWSTGEVI